MDTLNEFKDFLKSSEYLEPDAIAKMIGISVTTIWNIKNGKLDKCQRKIEAKIELFMKNYGVKLTNIDLALRCGSKKRIELHRKRVAILQRSESTPDDQSTRTLACAN